MAKSHTPVPKKKTKAPQHTLAERRQLEAEARFQKAERKKGEKAFADEAKATKKEQKEKAQEEARRGKTKRDLSKETYAPDKRPRSTALDVGKKQSGLTTGKLSSGSLDVKTPSVALGKLNVGDVITDKDGVKWRVQKI